MKWADSQKLTYITHKGRIPYILNGEERSYYPDFWVDDWNCFVDIKNEYHYSLQREKFDVLKKNDIEIKLLFKKDLLELGVIFD